ncbi:small VCP/p97-interacting protein isoform X2 [Oncorhynchus tshawytscha]|uniref:Small VCP/p97-interacting protein n=2 Tax=Oncorhynchus tshawytscha TaxID=74940 RepID=A0AAZ3RGK0_ONCTS|nr:small VCP/p97-interacting protein isoform X2 [Oncorhynchus tshawytscha]
MGEVAKLGHLFFSAVFHIERFFFLQMTRRFNKSMGMCLSCLGGAGDDVVPTPDPETRRCQLAEAAEKRQKETTYRGVKNPEAVERKKKKQEEMNKQEMTTSPSGGGLKWQVG